ncbi:MAG: hypothetical protein Q4C34_09910, partial [Bacteroidales bacterium]|nr:hypothetical protein [Bacteroidales bacterium]
LNPAIPGYTRDVAAETIKDGRDPYSVVAYRPCTLAPYHMDAGLQVETPLPGATALLVEMKDSYNGRIEDADKALDAIEAVSVITKQMYIGTEDGSTNPGYLFNVEASLNKFFIITKGSIRPLETGYPPFYNMYEEFRPSNNHPMYGAYMSMDAGMQFPVDHNCSTIIGQEHDIIMSPEGETGRYAINLMFYLPDYRFLGETRYKNEGDHVFEYYSFYDKDHQPYFFFNKIFAEVDGAVRIDPENHKAGVPVSWVSTYKDITRSQVPERFFVYRVIDDVVQSDPVPASELIVRQDDTALHDDGALVRSASHDVSIYVLEDQYETSRRVRYVIKGRRQGSEFSFVESNTVTADIPGYTRYETLSIVIDGQPVSAYDINRQVNAYDNAINLTDLPGAGGQRLLNGHITVRDGDRQGTRFELRRYLPGSDLYTIVATMEVTGQEPDKLWGSADDPKGVHVFNGTITYPEGTDTEGLPLTSRFKSEMDRKNPANDPFMPIVAVDGSNGIIVSFRDRFEASTARGEQPRGYIYRIVYEAAGEIVPGMHGTTAVSNAVSVSVPVRHLAVGYVPYSLDEIIADNDAETRLPLNPVGLAIVTAQNPAITGYEITDVTKNRLVARVRRSPSGKFDIFAINDNGVEDGSLNPSTTPAYSGKLPILLNSTVDIDDVFALTIIYGNGNTYGNIYSRLTPVPEPLVISAPLNFSSQIDYERATYSGGVEWATAGLNVRPWPAFNDDSVYGIYGYNVWGRRSEDPGYDLLYTPDGHSTYTDGNDSDGINSLIYDFDSHRATTDNPVSLDHIVRLYAAAPAELLIADDNADTGYVINETTARASLDTTDNWITGVEDITAAPDCDAQYYDLQGRLVDNPGTGVYIRRQGENTSKVLIK